MAGHDPQATGGAPQGAASGAPGERLIGGHYAVDPARIVLGGGGGLPAYVTERRGGGPRAMAVQARADAPGRVRAIAALSGAVIPGLLTPIAAGAARGADGRDALFVVCAAPPGPPLALTRPWSEPELLQFLLRPVAGVLAALAGFGVTHRAVRLDNLFRGGEGEPVVLGCGWASPPGLLQPAIYEPPYSAMCLPAGRGEGAIADDVYALGVAMLILALGKLPLAGLTDAEIVRRKLDQGSFKALVGQERLSPIVADLVRGMLAEDPDHRPPPTLLADPVAARARRVAARPPRRAQRALEVGGVEVWHARSLAHALASETAESGARLLRGGAVDGWLRRNLGEAALAARIEEAVRQRQLDSPGEDPRADAMLAMRAVVALDVLAPLAWDGIALWPDGMGALLAASPDEALMRPANLILAEAAVIWAASRSERSDLVALRLDMRQYRGLLCLSGWSGGMPRLRFELNPLLACRAAVLGGAFVMRPAELLSALEAAARPEIHATLPIDREIAAFLAARDDQRFEAALTGLGRGGSEAALASLRLLAGLQQRHGARPLPRLGAWLAHHLGASTESWRNRTRRERCAQALAAAAAEGQLGAMLTVLDDPSARAMDANGGRAAEEAVRRIDAELAAIVAGATARSDTARRIGSEMATAIGLAALGAMVIAVMAG
jgi:hypothetical protein